jgi:methylase of polypeptide subunit release factors
MTKTIYIRIKPDESIGEWSTQNNNNMLPLPFALNDILRKFPAPAYNFVFSFEGIDEKISLPWADGGLDGWPPSVDSWVIMSDLLSQKKNINPKSLIDIGAGSGILGLASLTIYDNLKEICFVENNLFATQKLRDYCRLLKVRGEVTLTIREEDVQWTLFAAQEYKPIPTSNLQAPKFDLLVSGPPYLPDCTKSKEDKNWLLSSTTGTALLISLITNHNYLAKRSMVYFGEIALFDITEATNITSDKDPRFRKIGYVPLIFPFLQSSINSTADTQSENFEKYFLKVVIEYFEKYIPKAEFLYIPKAESPPKSSQGVWLPFAEMEDKFREAFIKVWMGGYVKCRQGFYCFDSGIEEENAEVS